MIHVTMWTTLSNPHFGDVSYGVKLIGRVIVNARSAFAHNVTGGHEPQVIFFYYSSVQIRDIWLFSKLAISIMRNFSVPCIQFKDHSWMRTKRRVRRQQTAWCPADFIMALRAHSVPVSAGVVMHLRCFITAKITFPSVLFLRSCRHEHHQSP